MKISFHRFKLRPKVELNYLSSTHIREGVFLKSESDKGIGYCEYFPHTELGDESVDEFLKTFKEQKTLAQKKALYLLDAKWIDLGVNKRFFNHQFFQKGDSAHAKIIKYKIRHKDDFGFLELLEDKHILRLDANGLFSQESWRNFFSRIPQEFIRFIDYIEDPIDDGQWKNILLPCAQDFIQGFPSHVKIFKPYREFFSQDPKRIIFSGNMGHGLSNYQSYLELVHSGDLNEFHGILTNSIYQDSSDLFSGNYNEGFLPNKSELESYIKEIASLNWTLL
jgi:hypothetical protein